MQIRNVLARCVCLLGLATVTAVHATPVTVKFEDLGSTPIYDGYGGLSGWRDIGSVRENLYIPGGQGQYSFGGFNTAPDDGLGWDDGQGGLRFTDGPVIFEGAYFFNADVPANITTGILLYYQGQLVHRIADPMSGGLDWIASGYQGLVDTIYFAAGYDGFMIDNLTYSRRALVPEPSLPLLLVSGMGLLGWTQRKRNVRSLA